MKSSEVALQVLQEAVSVLAKWAGVKLPAECQCLDDNDAIARSKEILGWTKESKIKPLRLLFDFVKLPDGKGQNEHYYCPAVAIAQSDTRAIDTSHQVIYNYDLTSISN
ncbi:MAG TPA: hypothetical protein DD379_12335 [Cyanobacteria bacterium UBA11162]|nr:hypothetical protein [Cyanobacteria bacterium UBA11162]